LNFSDLRKARLNCGSTALQTFPVGNPSNRQAAHRISHGKQKEENLSNHQQLVMLG
jgi:hypothetical protein